MSKKGKTVLAYNLKQQKERPMIVKEIVSFVGKGNTKRYMLKGVDATAKPEQGMARICGDKDKGISGEAMAKALSKELGIPIKAVEAKEKKVRVKSCKAVAKRAEKRCEEKKPKKEKKPKSEKKEKKPKAKKPKAKKPKAKSPVH